MNTKTFTSAIKRLSAIPKEMKEKFLELGKSLGTDDQRAILTHLEFLNAQLQKNDTRYASSIQREKAAIEQVKQHDVSAFNALYHA